MTHDDYSGSVNWDAIYSAFHNPAHVAERIKSELLGCSGWTLYSGFSQVAVDLSFGQLLKFIDSSPDITARARKTQGNINEIITSDACLYAASTRANNLVIACRVSAFWSTPESFKNLLNAIQSHPRKIVLVDFYDSELIAPGMDFTFHAESGMGKWHIENIKESSDSNPITKIVTMRVSYSLHDVEFCYTTRRCFFDKRDIKDWVSINLPEYKMEFKPSLFECDPSFLLKLVPKTH